MDGNYSMDDRMAHAELMRTLAEATKLQVETIKYQCEASRIHLEQQKLFDLQRSKLAADVDKTTVEARWHPFWILATSLAGALTAAAAIFAAGWKLSH
ncbi:MAG: hypothetical protein WBW32_05245 [Luteibacter sp.]